MPNKSQQKDLPIWKRQNWKKKMSGYGRLTFLTENVLFEIVHEICQE